MKRGLLLLLGAVLLVAGRVVAEDASVQDDMRFIEELRKRGKSDLALEYLQRLAKTASPDLAKALPLEMARTRLEAAGEEPDSAKRLVLYGEARDEFQKWLQANPGDPRFGEVKLDLAHVTVQQGRTQLSRAFLNEEFEADVTPEATQARTLFEDAAGQLKQAAKDLDDQITKLGDPKTPADKELKKKLDQARIQADLDIALNLFDQGQTYPLNAAKWDAPRNKLYQDAQKAFEKIAVKDDTNPACWTAKAWVGRCIQMLGDSPKAKAPYKAILSADPRYAAEAQRLVRYFDLLRIEDLAPESRDPKDEDDAHYILRAKSWISDYPGKTPEGYGLRFHLAQKYDNLAKEEKDPVKRNEDLTEAGRYYRQVEESENDFTDRARRYKIRIIAAQPGFKGPIDQLGKFEVCYVRAQYELQELSKDEKVAQAAEQKAVDAEKAAQSEDDKKKAHMAVEEAGKQRDKVRQDHEEKITSALERGIKLADPSKRGDEGLELANAKAMLAYQYMNAKKYREAIAVGEQFARGDPRSSQAAAASVYVLQSYAEMVGKEEAQENPPAELKADRKGLFDFAQYMETKWSKEAAGDMARHQLSLLYINAKIDPDEADPAKRHATNVQEAIKALSRINPSYANYTVTQYQLAQYCLGADKEKLAPLDGEGADGYRKRALAALRGVPALVEGSDPTTSRVYFLAKARLAQEDFSDKNYDEMEKLTKTLLDQLSKATLETDPGKNKDFHDQFEASIKGYEMYAHWAKAGAEAEAADKAADPKDRPAHYKAIMALLDPIVDDIVAGKHPELQKDPKLAHGILDNDLRATIQLNNLDRTGVVISGYKVLATGGAADAGASEVLTELVRFIPPALQELKRNGDAAVLEAAKKKFGGILSDTLKDLPGDKLTPPLALTTAKIYSSITRHKDAADLLEKTPMQPPDKLPPPTDADAQTKQKFQEYLAYRLQLVQERRLNGEVPEARKLMDEILGDPKKPGWGRKEIPALIENIEVVAASGDYKSAAELANGLAQRLLPNIESNARLKEIYLQCDYLIVENVYRQGVKLKDKNANKYAELTKQAAGLAVELAKKQLGFVTDATRVRFRDLMEAEPDLKAAFLDAYLPAVEAMEKQAEAVQVTNEQRDRPVREKAFSDAASLIVDLEKMWPDYGSDAAKGRATTLLGNAELKAAYDKLKGVAATP